MSQLIELWPIVSGGILGVIWLIRLEGKVSYMERDLEILTSKTTQENERLGEKFSILSQQLVEVKLLLVRIEERLYNQGEGKKK